MSGDKDKTILSIGTQLGKLTSCSNIVIFTVDYSDSRLQKYKNFSKPKSCQWGCPDSECHESAEFALDYKTPIGWVATHRKGLKINDSSECVEYDLPKKGLHSVSSCFCK